MNTRIALGVLILCSLVPAYAQQSGPPVVAEGGHPDERASARILYFDRAKRVGVGEFAIDYGRPVWKSTYEDPAKFDQMTKGKVWRLGSNFFTTLDTCLPLKISGKEVPVGYYYLGLHRSDDGSKWSLAFIDPKKARAAHLDAFNIDKATVAFEVPMSTVEANGKPDKLTIDLSYPQNDLHNATLHIAWGTLALSAPIEIKVAD